jgi:hypothetical protein
VDRCGIIEINKQLTEIRPPHIFLFGSHCVESIWRADAALGDATGEEDELATGTVWGRQDPSRGALTGRRSYRRLSFGYLLFIEIAMDISTYLCR